MSASTEIKRLPIGILVHGRHLGAEGWERLVWGDPQAGKLGSVPRMVELVLQFVQQSALGTEPYIVFGTGSSEKDGLRESEYTKRLFERRVDQLVQFKRIRSLADQLNAKPDFFAAMAEEVICEVESLNTVQEIDRASAIFAGLNVGTVYHVACGSHLPRCVLSMLMVQEAGRLSGQRWYAVADDMTFGDVPIGDSVTIFEAPHRPDDVNRQLGDQELQPHRLLKRTHSLGIEGRIDLFRSVDMQLRQLLA